MIFLSPILEIQEVCIAHSLEGNDLIAVVNEPVSLEYLQEKRHLNDLFQVEFERFEYRNRS